MKSPEYNSPNLPPKEEIKFIPTEDDLALARQALEAAKQKYEQTKDVKDKISLVEAETRLEFLEKEMDLDFTKPEAIPGMEVREEDFASLEDKKEQLKETIREFDRILQDVQGRPGLMKIVEARKRKFEETLALLEQKPTEAKQEFWVPATDEDDPFRGDPQSRANHNAAAWRDANPDGKLI